MAITHLFGDKAQIKKMHAIANGNDNQGKYSILIVDSHLRTNSNADAETTVSRLLASGFKASVVAQDYVDTERHNIKIKAGELVASM